MKYIKIFIATALTIFAFMFDRIYDVKRSLLLQFASHYSYVNVGWCALALFILSFYWKNLEKYKGFHKVEAIFSVLFTIFMLLGRSFSLYNSIGMLETQKMMTLFAGIGWCIFFYNLCKLLVYHVERQQLVMLAKQKNKYLFHAIAFLIILVCWLPQFIFSMPGNVPYDGMNQLGQWFGYRIATNNHPWFMTMLFGFLMGMGRHISDNAGIIVIILAQFIFCAWAYSYVCLTVDKYAGRKAAYFAVLFFALVPMWGSFASTVVKDTLFYAVFALYFCSFVDVFEMCSKKEKNIVGLKKWILFGILSFLVCLVRNDGIYRIIPAGIVLFLAMQQGKRQLLAMLVSVCVCMVIYNTFIFNVLGISRGRIREMFSIPFQQTARYSRDHGKDITKKEKNIINKILPYDELAKIYRPTLSDPVKQKASDFGRRDFIKYLGVWAKMGLRHPGTYLQATINNSYGYYYPFYKNSTVYEMYIAGEPVNKGFNIYYTVKPEKREKLRVYNFFWRIAPGISLLSHPGTYTWIVLASIMIFLKRKKYRQLVVFSVLILQIAVCTASPGNGYLRYAMPLMACTPVLLAWMRNILGSIEDEV